MLLAVTFAVSSCKEEVGVKPDDIFVAKDFQYNMATKKMAPENELNGTIQSQSGIKLVYFYLLRTNLTPLLVHTEEPAVESQSDYTFSIPNSVFSALDMSKAEGLKIMVRHLDNSSSEGLVNVSSFTPAKPILKGFSDLITPNTTGGTTPVTGEIAAESGIAKIEIYDNYKGSFELVESITGLNNVLQYSLNYGYVYRKKANQVKVVVTDGVGVSTEVIIPLNVVVTINLFNNVLMTGHSTGTNTIFFSETGTTADNCSLNASESTMAFLYYGTGTGPSFYSPSNTANVAKNFKCSGVSWVIANAGVLRPTRFQVLVKGSSNGVDNIYSQYEANNIDNIADQFFADNGVSAPVASSARFDAAATPTTAIFNLTNAYLIYVRIPDAGSTTTYKNALIRVKEATSAVGTSIVKFDIIVQK